jgi:hypothetical protein
LRFYFHKQRILLLAAVVLFIAAFLGCNATKWATGREYDVKYRKIKVESNTVTNSKGESFKLKSELLVKSYSSGDGSYMDIVWEEYYLVKLTPKEKLLKGWRFDWTPNQYVRGHEIVYFNVPPGQAYRYIRDIKEVAKSGKIDATISIDPSQQIVVVFNHDKEEKYIVTEEGNEVKVLKVE